MALAFALNIFAVIPSAESHTTGEMASHYMASTTHDPIKCPEADRHNHIEKCGMASCAFGLPVHFMKTATTFGSKMLFDIWTAQMTFRHLTPPDRPPKI